MAAETRKPKDDPVEGSREVIDQELKRQGKEGKGGQSTGNGDREAPITKSQPPREDKELGPKGVP
jgi:hypothetical protein